jgi:hypothetical protein
MQADGAARSEFERAAQSGTLRAPPTTTPPKPSEATLGFSSTRKTIDNSPVRRYSSGHQKRWFKFPILRYLTSVIPNLVHRKTNRILSDGELTTLAELFQTRSTRTQLQFCVAIFVRVTQNLHVVSQQKR